MLRMHARQILSPMQIQWLYIHNTARLEWGRERGFMLKDITFSRKTGLIMFPGLDDENFIPPCVSGLAAPSMTATDWVLWRDFVDSLKSFKHPLPCWDGLRDLAIRWYSGTEPVVTDEELKKTAADCLTAYLIRIIPLHLAHLLMHKAETDHNWLKGRSRKGKIIMAHYQEALDWAFNGAEDVAYQIHCVTMTCTQFPDRCKEILAELFQQCSAGELHPVFRHTFGKDAQFQQDLAQHLTVKFGEYEELDFTRLINPLPAGFHPDQIYQMDQAGGRASKRQKLDENQKGLISFK
jgi:hypothetical protein